MQTDWKFYRDWFDWAVEKAEALARSGDFLNLAQFVRELLQVVWLLVGLLESLRALFKGNLVQIGLRAVDWARKNPDPLLPARQQMRDLRLKWGEVAEAPAAVPFALEPSG